MASYSIFDIFDSKAIAAYWTDVNTAMKDPMIGSTFFPDTRTASLELSWIKGRNNLPIALQPSAFDTKASLRDRIGVTEISTEMPFFREAMRIGEKERQDIQNLLAKGIPFAQPTIARVYDDIANLVDGARVQAERMRMSLLVNGKISVTATKGTGRDITYQYNYDPNGDWASDHSVTLASKDTWTVANKATSDPIGDLLDAKEAMADQYGITLTRALMTTKTLRNMLASESIKKAMNPLGATSMILLDTEAKRYLEQQTGLTIITYDKMFKDEEGVDQKFYPDNYVTLLPSYAVGNTWFGTTPEEYDFMSGNTNASVSVVGSGIAITTIKEPHPVNVFTVVDAIALPSFERMDDIYVMKVV